MSLFDATVSQVVKDVSDKTLIPVLNRSAADYCQILSLIERKTRSWYLPWKSAYKYIPTELSLNDILLETVDVKSLLSSSIIFQNYTSTPSFHKAGKIGGKIADEFEVDVNVNETLQVSLKLGNVTKQEVRWQKLFDTVNGQKVQLDHPLVKAITRSGKRSLFLIGMVVTSGSTSCLDKDSSVKGDLGGSPQVALNLNSSGSSDSKQHRQYTIPLGTTLAYCCYKLIVDNDGTINLQLADDLTDGPNVDENTISEVENEDQVLSGLLTNEMSDELIILLRNMLKVNPTCAFKLNVVIENAIDTLEERDVLCVLTVNHLLKLLPDDCATNGLKFLEKIGFQINKKENKLVVSQKLDLLISLSILLDCLSEMSSAQIQALTDCNFSHKNDLLLAIQCAINSTDLNNNEFSETCIAENHPVGKFLKSIGLNVVYKTDSSLLVEYLPKSQSRLYLRHFLVVVCGMCSV